MKNKKILGALAALCMGVILCVSSVFAVNYWYTITNTDNNGNHVTMGNALTLNLADADEDEQFLYPGGSVTFSNIAMTGVLNWKWNDEEHFTQTGGIENVKLPKFALRVKEYTVLDGNGDEATNAADFAGLFTVNQNYTGAMVGVGTLDSANLLILDDLQAKADEDGEITIALRLDFNANASAIFANYDLSFVLEIVAYVDADDDGYTASDVLTADQNNSLPGTDPANGEDAVFA